MVTSGLNSRTDNEAKLRHSAICQEKKSVSHWTTELTENTPTSGFPTYDSLFLDVYLRMRLRDEDLAISSTSLLFPCMVAGGYYTAGSCGFCFIYHRKL